MHKLNTEAEFQQVLQKYEDDPAFATMEGYRDYRSFNMFVVRVNRFVSTTRYRLKCLMPFILACSISVIVGEMLSPILDKWLS